MTDGTKSVVQMMKSMAGVDIMNGTSYKSTYQILDELHSKWSDLTDAEQAAISEAVGGKRGGNVLASLMNNWADAQKALQSSLNSQGSAEREEQHYEQSVQYRIDQLKASGQELAQNFLNADFLKGAIQSANTLLQILNSIVKTLGSAQSMVAGFALADFFKGAITNGGIFASIFKKLAANKDKGAVSEDDMFKNIKTAFGKNVNKPQEPKAIAQEAMEAAAVNATTAAYHEKAAAIQEVNAARQQGNISDVADDTELLQTKAQTEAIKEKAQAEQAETIVQNQNTAGDMARDISNGAQILDDVADGAKALDTVSDDAKDAAKNVQLIGDGAITASKGIEQISEKGKDASKTIEKVKDGAQEAGIVAGTTATKLQSGGVALSSAGVVLGVIGAVVAALMVATTIWDKTHKSYEQVQSDMEESMSNYKKAAQDVQSYKQQISEVKQEMSELEEAQANHTITTEQKARLDALKQQNQELQIQLQTSKQLQEVQGMQAARDSSTLSNTKKASKVKQQEEYGKGFFSKLQYDLYTKTGSFGQMLAASNKWFANLIGWNDRVDYLNSLTTTDAEQAELEAKKYSEVQNALTKAREDYNNALKDTSGSQSAKKSQKEAKQALDDAVQDYTDFRGNIADTQIALENQLQGLKAGNISGIYSDQIDKIQKELRGIKEIGMTDAQRQLSRITSIFDGSDGAEAIRKYVQAAVDGGKKASDAIRELGINLQSLDIDPSAFDNYFSSIADGANNAAEAVAKFDGTFSSVSQAFQSENQGENYDKIKDYLKQAQDLYDKGLVGTDDFQSAVEFLSPDVTGKKTQDYFLDAQAYMADWNALRSKRERYFGDEDMTNMQNVMADLASAGYMQDMGDGAYKMSDGFKNSAQAAKALGISVNAAETALHKMQEYGAQFGDQFVWNGEQVDSFKSSLDKVTDNYKTLMQSNPDSKLTQSLGKRIDQWNQDYEKYQQDSSLLTKDQVVHIKYVADLTDAEVSLQPLQEQAKYSGYTDSNANAAALAQYSQIFSIAEQDYKNNPQQAGYSLQGGYSRAMGLWNQISNDLPKLSGKALSNAQKTMVSMGQMMNNYLLNGSNGEDFFHYLGNEGSSVLKQGLSLMDKNSEAYKMFGSILDSDTEKKKQNTKATKENNESSKETTQNKEGTKKAQDFLQNEREYKNNKPAVTEDPIKKTSTSNKAPLATPLGNENRYTVKEGLDTTLAELQANRFKNEVEKDPIKKDVKADTSGAKKTVSDFANSVKNKPIEQKVKAKTITSPTTMSPTNKSGTSGLIVPQASSITLQPKTTTKVQTVAQSTPKTTKTITGTINYKLGKVAKPNGKSATGTINYKLGKVAKPSGRKAVGTINYHLGKVAKPVGRTATGTINYRLGRVAVPKGRVATGTINYRLGRVAVPQGKVATGTINYRLGHVASPGKGSANGTAHSNGSTQPNGAALAHGNWGLKKNQSSLINELGPEIIVRNGQWFTVNNGYPAFASLKSGDIVFNHVQSEALLKNGYVTGSHARMALASGTVGGKAYAAGSRGALKLPLPGASSSASHAASNAAASSAKAAASSAKAAASSKDASDKSKETLDWIEVLIKRTERQIDILNRVSENASETYGSRNNAISGQLNWLNTEISYQQQGAARYIQQANSVGLSQDWAAKVRNGKIDIEDITDEDLKQKISDYQNWYQKALDCQDAVYQLQQKEQDLYKTRFDNVQGQFDNAISLLTHESDLISKWIDVTQEQGHIVGQTYYTNLIKLESVHIQDLSAEYNSLNDSLRDAVNNGRIAEGTEQWYNMKKAINDVESAIMDATKSLATYKQNLKQIEWDKDDYIQDRIDDLNTEFKFLYDIMDSNKFFDKRGQVTDTGTAAFGLDAMQYDTYMRKAELYRDQLQAIDKDLATDPNNTTYLKRRQEIVKSYQEAVKSAKEEKDTIKDLVKTGYDKQLSSLQKIISKYEQLLDDEKSARQYADQVAEKQKTINDLQKQIMAMSGDTSEEGRATRQKTNESLEKAKKDLQDTQDDYRISEIKNTLSNLTTVFQQDIDNRLDGIDELIAEVISGVNENGANISTTIQNAADEYGVALSNTTQSILSQVTNSSGDIQGHSDKLVTDFRDGEFKNTSASILNGIAGIKSIVDGMYANAQKQAETKVQAVYSHKLAEAYKAAEDARNAAAQAQAKQQQAAAKQAASSGKSDKDNYGVALAIINGNYGWGNAPGRYQRLQSKGYDAAKVQDIVNKLWREGLVHSSAWQGRYYGLTLGDLARYRYASGAERIPNRQVAWTNEGAPEAIIRKSDGAVLTRLNTGDTVFNGMATKRLWDFGNNPEEFLKNMNLIGNNPVQNIQSVNANYEINFNLPNVTNSRDFMYEIKNNPQFAKMLQEVTLGKVVGHNSLKKNSINF